MIVSVPMPWKAFRQWCYQQQRTNHTSGFASSTVHNTSGLSRGLGSDMAFKVWYHTGPAACSVSIDRCNITSYLPRYQHLGYLVVATVPGMYLPPEASLFILRRPQAFPVDMVTDISVKPVLHLQRRNIASCQTLHWQGS